MGVKIVEFREVNKNGLDGFATALICNDTLEVRDIAVRETDGRKWVALPSKSFLKGDRTTAYYNIVRFPDKAQHEAFSRELLQALEEYRGTRGTVAKKEQDIGDLPF